MEGADEVNAARAAEARGGAGGGVLPLLPPPPPLPPHADSTRIENRMTNETRREICMQLTPSKPTSAHTAARAAVSMRAIFSFL